MSKVVFKQYHQGQVCMFPVSLDEKISSDAPVRLVKYEFQKWVKRYT